MKKDQNFIYIIAGGPSIKTATSNISTMITPRVSLTPVGIKTLFISGRAKFLNGQADHLDFYDFRKLHVALELDNEWYTALFSVKR